MCNLFDCCFKKPIPEPLSIEEVYESLSNKSDDSNWVDSILYKLYFGTDKKISWRTDADIYKTYSNEEYDRSGYKTVR